MTTPQQPTPAVDPAGNAQIPRSTGEAGRIPPGPAGVPATPTANDEVLGLTRPTVVVSTYDDYASAQRAIDYLSDNQFPVDRTAIVGTGLRLVERVLGRLTVGRAAVSGAAGGAWFGLLIGLLFGIFSVSAWWTVLLAAVLIGAVWGAIFGAVAHAMTGGRRDFTSRSTLEASQYAVTVDPEHADEARQLLVRLNWQTSGAGD